MNYEKDYTVYPAFCVKIINHLHFFETEEDATWFRDFMERAAMNGELSDEPED